MAPRIRVRDLVTDWRRGDAEKLARFINESGRGWPGGGWDPKTPEEAERRFREQRLLGAFVAEVGGEIVSYCDVTAKPNERNRAYIPFLNAHPDYHGQGFGKAVLLRAVERVYELGIARVDLHTWPGNLKAVPLYKKSGFMWSPEEPWGVLMQNFTPGARRHPAAQEFFRKHDWYRTMKRDLSLSADDHKRGKVRVYPYEWEEEGDRLRMVYDRQSWGLLEMETNDFLVGCWIEDEKLVAGMPHRIRWQIVNHRQRPLEVVLVASADDQITLDRKQMLRVKERAELSAEFQIAPEIKEKEEEPRAPIIRTDLLVDGTPIALAAGFSARQAVSFSLDAEGVGLRPGRPERVVIQAWSELDRSATATLRVSASGGTQIEGAQAARQLPPKGSAEIPVTLTVTEPGPISLRVESEVKAGRLVLRPKPATLHTLALRPGDVSGYVTDDRVVMESVGLRVNIWRRGGWLSVTDKLRHHGDVAGVGSPQLGPPYAWDDFFDKPCEARIEHQEGRVVAVLATPSIHRPGVRLERRITVSSLPLIEIQDTLVNGCEGRLEGRLQVGARLRGVGGWTSVPTAGGIVRDLFASAGRSLFEHGLAEEGDRWPEGWMAAEEGRGVVTGLLWQQAQRVRAQGWWSGVEREFEPAEPGGSSALAPLYLFVGEGDYFTVRRWWQHLFGPRVCRDQLKPETRRPLEFGLRPRPLVVHGREGRGRMAVESVGKLALEGRLRLGMPKGLKARPSRIEFSQVSEKHSTARPVSISRAASLPEGGYFVDCTAEIDRAIYRERQPIIALGDAKAKVMVKQSGRARESWVVNNGLLTLTIAPGFCGSAISLQRDGEELLRSAYPRARPLAWENPWFGGIHPWLGALGRDLSKEQFGARPVARRGRQGIAWQGVRVSCSPKQERGRHLKLAVDYLLAPGSSIIALAVRTTRCTDTGAWLNAGFTLWPVLGGSHLEAELVGEHDRRASRLRCQFGGDLRGERWVIAENRRARAAALLACPGGKSEANANVFGEEGYFLSAGREGWQEGRETRETVFFAAFTAAERARDLAEALSQLTHLP